MAGSCSMDVTATRNSKPRDEMSLILNPLLNPANPSSIRTCTGRQNRSFLMRHALAHGDLGRAMKRLVRRGLC
jgi:hypothetical protein